MISPEYFFNLLQQHGFTFYAGVPDSLLKDFCAYVTDHTSAKDHIIAANEGNAIALAAGYHLATGKNGVVYLQNSGLGNCINPLTSLTDKEIYSLPVLLLIGWRAEPGKKDEPQHLKMGKITLPLLDTLDIPYSIVPDSEEEAKQMMQKAVHHFATAKTPYALIARDGIFEAYSLQKEHKTDFPLNREEALKIVASQLGEKDIIVSTTGKTSRELFEFRETTGKNKEESHKQDFLTVGSMGHSSAIAIGIALQKPRQKVYCFDGDGALIMHMGILSTVGKLEPANFNHIIFNNFAHDSVGGQPTAADAINILELAKANGYKTVFRAETAEEIKNRISKMQSIDGPTLLEIRCNKGARKNLGRPTQSPQENKKQFMNFLQQRD